MLDRQCRTSIDLLPEPLRLRTRFGRTIEHQIIVDRRDFLVDHETTRRDIGLDQKPGNSSFQRSREWLRITTPGNSPAGRTRNGERFISARSFLRLLHHALGHSPRSWICAALDTPRDTSYCAWLDPLSAVTPHGDRGARLGQSAGRPSTRGSDGENRHANRRVRSLR